MGKFMFYSTEFLGALPRGAPNKPQGFLKKRIFVDMEDEHIYKRHSKSLLMYHIVLPIKYLRSVITDAIGQSLKGICMYISSRYEIGFIEIG